MCRGDQLNSALGNGPGRDGLFFGADLVDDNDLGHMVFNGFDHYRMLTLRRWHLHPARLPDSRMWNVVVAGDLVRRIYDDDPLAQIGR